MAPIGQDTGAGGAAAIMSILFPLARAAGLFRSPLISAGHDDDRANAVEYYARAYARARRAIHIDGSSGEAWGYFRSGHGKGENGEVSGDGRV